MTAGSMTERSVLAAFETVDTWRRRGLMLLALSKQREYAGNSLVEVARFGANREESPENLTIDRNGYLYVSLRNNNEICRISPSGRCTTYATLDGGAGSVVCGLVTDDDTGRLFVACNPAGKRATVIAITAARSQEVVATFPAGAVLSGIAPDEDGNLYVADAVLGRIWQVPSGGGRPLCWAELWASGSAEAPGLNGVQFDKRRRYLYVSITNQCVMYRIPITDEGRAGMPELFASGIAADDFAFDREGNLYVATRDTRSVIKIAPNGQQETVAAASDGLHRTTDVAFGRCGDDKTDLYILSASLSGTSGSPSRVYKMDVGIAGIPVRLP